MADAHSTAQQRRRIAINALGRELSGEPTSASGRLAAMLDQNRPMIVSADIDGLVSAAMLGSVAKKFEIVAFSVSSSEWLVHPSHLSGLPDNAFGVDVFSVLFDNVSNHVIQWGTKKFQNAPVLQALQAWDAAVDAAGTQKLLAVPSIWAGIQGGYEDHSPTSSKYKYPFGTAQILLAMLEVVGKAPRFFDRTYLPWLVANCDGGISTYSKYANNARVWWPVMAGAVGPGSLTEQIFRMVDTMRPHDFLDAVHRLDRERQAQKPIVAPWLNDNWNLVPGLKINPADAIERALTWLTELTGWRDPVMGGIASLSTWARLPLLGSGQIYFAGKAASSSPTIAVAKHQQDAAVALIQGAQGAGNANFFMGGPGEGSRFNWAGLWDSAHQPAAATPGPAAVVTVPAAQEDASPAVSEAPQRQPLF